MLGSILSSPRSTLSSEQTLDLANSYLKLAREHYGKRKFTVALPLYEQAAIALEKLDPEHRKLSLSYWTGKFRKASYEPRTQEDQTFKTLLAEVYIERGETFQALGHYTKAQASYKNAHKYGHPEAVNKLDQLKSLLPAKGFHLFGQGSTHSSRVYLLSSTAAVSTPFPPEQAISDNLTVFFINNPTVEEPQLLGWPENNKFKNTQELIAFFKQHETAANGLSQHKEAQEKLTQHEEAIDGLKQPNLSQEKRRALKAQVLSQEKKQTLEKLLLSPEQHQALTTHELSKNQQGTLLLLARGVLNEFAKKGDKTCHDICEVVTLAAISDLKLQRSLIGQFIKAIYEDPLLDEELLNGLAQVIRHLKPGELNANDGVQILKILHNKQEDLHDNTTDDGFALLQALTALLDAMADAEIKGLSRDQLHSPLYKTLQTLSESEDVRFAFQASYACQALLHVPDDEKLWQSVFRRTLAVGGGVMALATVVRTCDPQKLFEMFEHFSQAFEGLDKVLSTANEIYNQGQALYQKGANIVDNVRTIREGLSFNFKRPWYTALRYTDFLIQSQQFMALEAFALQMPVETRKYPHFVTGLSQQLEQVVRTTADLSVRQSALAFLADLYHNDERWGRLAKPMIIRGLARALQVAQAAEPAIQEAADACLRRLAQGLTPYKQTLDQQYLEKLRSVREEVREPLLFESDTAEAFPTALLQKVEQERSLQNIDTEFELLNKKLAELTQGWGRDNPAALSEALASLKDSYLKETFDLYIPLQGKKQGSRAEDAFGLEKGVLDFLNSRQESVLLIHGEAGVGKSTFGRQLAQKLWEKSIGDEGTQSNPKKIIPLLIPLAAMTSPANNLIQAYLKQQGFSTQAIQKLKQEENQTLVFILDGYDEIAGIQNLYISNELDKWPAKVIISCRTEYLASLGKDYQSRFLPKGDEKESLKAFREIALLPFADEQIREYINKYIQQKNPDGWSDKDYWQLIERIPNLKDLVRNPFLLTITIEVLPNLLEPGQEAATAQITRIDLYDQFVRQWFARAKQKLEAKQLAKDEKAAFEDLIHDDFVQCGIQFAKDLAAAMYIHNAGNPVLEYSRFKDASWKQVFFGPGEDQKLLRQAWPLHRIRNQYQFIHKSLLEYFMARAVFEPGTSAQLIEEEESSAFQSLAEAADNSTNLRLRRLSFESEIAKEEISANTENTSLLFKKNFASHPSVIHFLAERARKEPVFKAQLFDFIKYSKDETQGKDFRKAAANAITILIRAGVQFNGENLEGIQVPGADLSYGSFDHAQLQKTDLRNVNFQNAWLQAADLNGAKMEGVQFGEWPGLQQEDMVTVCTHSPDRKTFAVGLANGNISLYDASTWKKRRSLNGHTDWVNSIVYSPNGEQIASASRDKTIRQWKAQTGQPTHILSDHTNDVTSVVYAPNGEQIASASRDKTIRVWNAQTGTLELILLGHTNDVTSVMYSPNSQQIVSASRDKTIRLWDTQTGESGPILGRHTIASEITSVAYSPDAQKIASASRDNTIRLWDVQTGAIELTLEGHTSEITSVAYSPNAQHIASASRDNTIRVWDVQTGVLVRILEGHTSDVTSVAYSPDAQHIASASRDKTIRLWDVQTGEHMHTLEGHTSDVTSVVYSPNARQIASASSDKTIRVWDVQTGVPVRTLEGHTSDVTSVAYSPDAQQIASASRDNTIRVWDVQTGAIELTLEGHTSEITSVVYSPDAQHIASASRDNMIQVWDAQTGELMHTLEGHTSDVTSVVYSPDAQQIVSASSDKTIRVWDARSGKFEHILGNHAREVTSALYSPTAQQIVSTSNDHTIRMWDAQTGALIHILRAHISDVTNAVYSPNGEQIASASRDKTIRLWDVQTGELMHTLEGHTSDVTSVVYSPDAQQIASASRDNTIRLWNARTGEPTNTLSGHTDGVMGVAYFLDGKQLVSGSRDKTVRVWSLSAPGTALRILSGHDDGVMSVSVSPDGQHVVSGSRDNTVRLWDMQTGVLAHILSSHTGYVTRVVYSPNGQQLASSSEDMTVLVWDAQIGQLIHPLKGHTAQVTHVVYSPSGKQITSASGDRTIRLWDAQSGQLTHTLERHTSDITSIVYSPRGGQIASASGDRTIRFWDAQSGQLTHTLKGHTSDITSVVYSPRGGQIASASGDRTIRLWDANTGTLKRTLQGHTSDVTSVVYSPSGKQLASGSDDQTVRLWDAQSGLLIHTLAGHTSDITSVVYSLSGEQLASGSDDQTVRLWDAQTGQCLAVIRGFSGRVNSVVWKTTSDGNYLVTGSQDKSVRVWQVIANDGQCRVVLRWSSSQEALTAVNTVIQDVQGLSPVNQRLLEQRGAVGKPIPPLNFDQTSKQLIGVTAAVSKFKQLSKRRTLDTLPATQPAVQSVSPVSSANEQSLLSHLA